MKRPDDLAERIEQTTALLRQAALAGGMAITADGRISESAAAELIGYQPATLRTMRNTFGTGPTWYRAPAGGAQVSYRLADLAAWLEAKREGSNL